VNQGSVNVEQKYHHQSIIRPYLVALIALKIAARSQAARSTHRQPRASGDADL
jgi:hypothetical protein